MLPTCGVLGSLRRGERCKYRSYNMLKVSQIRRKLGWLVARGLVRQIGGLSKRACS